MPTAGPSDLPPGTVRPPARDERLPVRHSSIGPLRLSGVTLAALGFHTLLFASVIYFEQYRDRQVTAAQETPVDIVDEIPKEAPQEEQPQPKAPESPQQASEAAQPPPGSPDPVSSQSAPLTPEASDKPAPPQAADPKPAQAPPLAAPPKPQQPAQSTPAKPEPGPAVPVPAAQDRAGEAEGPREVALPPSRVDPPTPSEHDAATADFPFVPETFRSAALPGADHATEDSYKSLVFGLLERAKRIPAGAQARGAQGTALVSFQLDRAGNLITVSLVRSTGDRELDAEAVALVRRASPFPKPPVGVMLNFTPLIYFGETGALH